MTLNDKILEILNNKAEKLDEAFPGAGKNKEESPAMQGSSKKAEVKVLDKGSQGGETIRKSSAPLAAGAGHFEAKPAKQGDSKDAEKEELDANAPGKTASAKAKKMPVLVNKGAGKAPNFSTTVDPKTVVNQSSSKGNVHVESTETDETKEEIKEVETEVVETETELAERTTDAGEAEEKAEKEDAKSAKKKSFKKMKKEDIDRDIKSLFSADVDLSEEFKTKAASLFEAVVEARVSDEIETIEEELAQEAVELIEAFKADLVEQANGYFEFMAEEWFKENEVAVVNMLRTEIAEEFMENVREALIKSNIDVPEERFDVVEELTARIEALEAELSEQTKTAETVAEELIGKKRDAVLVAVSEGLAKTEAEKLRSLTENVTFEDEATFTEKLTVIKENYFSKAPVDKKESTTEVVGAEELNESPFVAAAANAIAKAVR